MKISIAIPTWECYGKGGEFLDDLLRTIEIQTFKNFEVCISDHSKDDKVLNKVKEFQNKFDIQTNR
jgi:glycosyltransferase involved in cell wall biosynthesis